MPRFVTRHLPAALLAVAAALALAPSSGAQPDQQQCPPGQPPPPDQQQQCQQQSMPGLPDLPNPNNRQDKPAGVDVGSVNCMMIDGIPTVVSNGQVFEGYHNFGPPCWSVFGVDPHL